MQEAPPESIRAQKVFTYASGQHRLWGEAASNESRGILGRHGDATRGAESQEMPGCRIRAVELPAQRTAHRPRDSGSEK